MSKQQTDYSRPEQLSGLFEQYWLSKQSIGEYAQVLMNGGHVDIRVSDMKTLRIHRSRFELVGD